MKKIETYTQFQIGFMLTITNWYKDEREWVLSLPFVDICIKEIKRIRKCK
jgi:hypothetical protein